MSRQCQTEFAPAERMDAGVLDRQAAALAGAGMLAEAFDAVNDLVVVLNGQRQIVLANLNVAALLGVEDRSMLRGLRPGEAIGCVRACEMSGGCGAAKFCSTCGAVNAILTSLSGRPDVRECRILRGRTGQALDLLVRTTPITVGGERFVVCAFADISHEKRRRALERFFFHDVLNTAIGVKFLVNDLGQSASGSPSPEVADLQAAVEQLVREIAEQRDLMAAETSELAVHPRPFSATDLAESLVGYYRRFPCAKDRTIRLEAPEQDVAMQGDPSLLARVLGNMVRNALEACPPDGTVTVGVASADSRVEFRVHNPGAMSETVQAQLFQRSFSTKGDGRGLGAYSIKLLTERYLGGNVSFRSSEPAGTVFTASFPATFRPA